MEFFQPCNAMLSVCLGSLPIDDPETNVTPVPKKEVLEFFTKYKRFLTLLESWTRICLEALSKHPRLSTPCNVVEEMEGFNIRELRGKILEQMKKEYSSSGEKPVGFTDDPALLEDCPVDKMELLMASRSNVKGTYFGRFLKWAEEPAKNRLEKIKTSYSALNECFVTSLDQELKTFGEGLSKEEEILDQPYAESKWLKDATNKLKILNLAIKVLDSVWNTCKYFVEISRKSCKPDECFSNRMSNVLRSRIAYLVTMKVLVLVLQADIEEMFCGNKIFEACVQLLQEAGQHKNGVLKVEVDKTKKESGSSEDVQKMSDEETVISSEEVQKMSDEETVVSSEEVQKMSDEETVVSPEEVQNMSDEETVVSPEEVQKMSDEETVVSSQEVQKMSDEETVVSSQEVQKMSDEETMGSPKEVQKMSDEETVVSSQEVQKLSEEESEDSSGQGQKVSDVVDASAGKVNKSSTELDESAGKVKQATASETKSPDKGLKRPHKSPEKGRKAPGGGGSAEESSDQTQKDSGEQPKQSGESVDDDLLDTLVSRDSRILLIPVGKNKDGELHWWQPSHPISKHDPQPRDIAKGSLQWHQKTESGTMLLPAELGISEDDSYIFAVVDDEPNSQEDSPNYRMVWQKRTSEMGTADKETLWQANCTLTHTPDMQFIPQVIEEPKLVSFDSFETGKKKAPAAEKESDASEEAPPSVESSGGESSDDLYAESDPKKPRLEAGKKDVVNP